MNRTMLAVSWLLPVVVTASLVGLLRAPGDSVQRDQQLAGRAADDLVLGDVTDAGITAGIAHLRHVLRRAPGMAGLTALRRLFEDDGAPRVHVPFADEPLFAAGRRIGEYAVSMRASAIDGGLEIVIDTTGYLPRRAVARCHRTGRATVRVAAVPTISAVVMDPVDWAMRARGGGGSVRIGERLAGDAVVGDDPSENESLVLAGTHAAPIAIDGIVFVRGDIVLAGVVTGAGCLVAGRSIRILGDIERLPTAAVPRPFLGLHAATDVVVGDPSDPAWRLSLAPHLRAPTSPAAGAAGRAERFTPIDEFLGLLPAGAVVGDLVPPPSPPPTGLADLEFGIAALGAMATPTPAPVGVVAAVVTAGRALVWATPRPPIVHGGVAAAHRMVVAPAPLRVMAADTADPAIASWLPRTVILEVLADAELDFDPNVGAVATLPR